MALAATPNPEQIQRNENEIKDLKRTLQSLDIELQAQMSKVPIVGISWHCPFICSQKPPRTYSTFKPTASYKFVVVIKVSAKWEFGPCMALPEYAK